MTLFNRAIPVLKSDTINIPQPGEYRSASSSTTGATLTTIGAEFKGIYNTARTGYSDRVAVGDVVYVDDNATGRPAFITQVSDIIDDDTLTLDPAVGGIAAPYNYKIYRSHIREIYKNVPLKPKVLFKKRLNFAYGLCEEGSQKSKK